MTIPVWPSELPPPDRPGFERGRGEGRSLFRNDMGPPSIRQRFAATVKPYSLTFTLTREHLGILDYFYEADTEQGSKPFIMPDPLTDGFPMLDEDGVPLLDEDDAPLLFTETMLVMFADQGLPTDTSRAANTFPVTVRLWRLPT